MWVDLVASWELGDGLVGGDGFIATGLVEVGTGTKRARDWVHTVCTFSISKPVWKTQMWTASIVHTRPSIKESKHAKTRA